MPHLTLLHAAELRLDAPFHGVGQPPEPLATLLRDASLAAWEALVECALSRHVTALLLAGGLCDGLERGVRAQARLRDGLARLTARGIAVAVALGPRDPHTLAVGPWPDGVTVFPPTGATLTLAPAGAPPLTIHGVSCPPETTADDAVRRLRRGEAPGLHIGLLPAGLAGAAADAALRCTLDTLLAAQLDLWALGGTRAPALVRSAAPWIVHASTPQGRSVAEHGPRGASLIEIEDGAVARVVLEPLDRVRCLELPVAVGRGADAAEPCAAALLRARESHRERPLVVEAALSGDVDAWRAPALRAALLARLRRDASVSTPLVWWAGVRLAPPAPLDLTADDLRGEVARQRQAIGSEPEQLARFCHQHFAPLSGAWSAALEPRDAEALLDDAAALAAAALADAESRR